MSDRHHSHKNDWIRHLDDGVRGCKLVDEIKKRLKNSVEEYASITVMWLRAVKENSYVYNYSCNDEHREKASRNSACTCGARATWDATRVKYEWIVVE